MKRATTGVLIGGGVAATLDIVYAFVMSAQAGIPPTRVLQSVASGWLGKQAFNGGMPAAVLGLLSHYGILFVAAALYLAASRRFPLLRHRAVICGLVFGVGMYLFMNFVVVPLAAVPFEFSVHAVEARSRVPLVHSVLVGLPIALAIRRFSPSEVRS